MRTTRFIRLAIALAISIAVTLVGAPVRATSVSTDQTDLWWNPAESGWGIQFVHTGNALFATMYAYDAAGQPIWYTATLEAQATPSTWSGDLLVTSGPWFGATQFNPAQVGRRTVGRMTWKAQSVESGTLTYVVDGVSVSKTLTRQTLRYDDQRGTFFGAAKLEYCTPAPAGTVPTSSGFVLLYTCLQYPVQATFTIDPAASGLAATAKIPITSPPTDCTFTGDYAQFGHFGKSQGTFACTDGTRGTHTFDQMTVQRVGLFLVGTAQLSGSDTAGHTFTVTMTGVR